MDLFDTDRKLSDLSETQFDDFLEGDIFTPPSNTTETIMDFSLDNGLDHDIDVTDHGMDQDWLDTFFDPVLNDRMISDALQPPPHVQSEHSYSLANNDQALDMSIKKEEEKDLERELLGTTVNPNSMTPTTPTMIVPQSTAPTSLLTTAATRTINQQQQQVTSKLSGTTNSSIMKTNATPNAEVKTEPVDQETTMVTVTRTTNPHTLLKPTIILATQSSLNSQHHPHIVSSHNAQNITTAHIKQERIVLPKSTTLTTSGLPVTSAVTVKVEPVHTMSSSTSSASSPELNYDAISLPPTPPSSNTSDSEGCQSPERSLPSSPVRQSLYTSRAAYRATPSPPPYHGGSQPFLMHPIPSSGVLMLSEEEKRTLITEGYPIPSKLPLSKTEEKNLKKIRRKIKNKISAQESRRKKKEYLESLERKVESFCQENVDLKKKVDSLESSNRSLLSQLHKLQSLVGKMRPQNASVPGSCLMVLVLCFAVFLGSWSPSSINVGYSSVTGSIAAPSSLVGPDSRRHGEAVLPGGLVDTVMAPDGAMGGSLSKHSNHGDGLSDNTGNLERTSNGESNVMLPENANPYSTPNMKSRVLLSIEEESDSNEEVYGPSTPFCLQDMLTRWFNLGAKIVPSAAPTIADSDTLRFDPTLPKINTLDVEMEINQTGNEDQQGGQGHFTKNAGQQGSSEKMAAENDKAIMHPDISVMTPSRQVNATA